jgi:putative membrane protein
VRAGHVGDGFVTAIDAVGKILAERAPRGTENRNELPDRLIEI